MNKILRKLLSPTRGQSLVEMAVTAPILIFMLLGLFEVGWALRSYLVLTNVNREITRFAVRPGYLNFANKAEIEKSYLRVREWVNTANTGQLELDFNDPTGNATLIVSHLVADTGLPCDDISSNPGGCNCQAFVDNPDANPGFVMDDIIIHPGIPGMEYQAMRFGPASGVVSRTTHLNYPALAKELAAQNNKFNCEIIKKGGTPSSNNMVVTELFLDQPQLFGFPLISNPYTDPVPLYAHTSMRLVGAARSTGTATGNITSGINTLGPICIALPLTLHQSALNNKTPQVDTVDILGGPSSSKPGWLAWDPQWNNKPDMVNMLNFPATSMNSYTDPSDPSGADHTLNPPTPSDTDYVAAFSGITSGLEPYIETFIGKEINIPVYRNMNTFVVPRPSEHGTYNVDAYEIVAFIKVRINQGGIQLNASGGGPYVNATYIGPSDACQAP